MVDKQENHAFVTIRLLAMGIVQTAAVAEESAWSAWASISFWNTNRSKSAVR
jgi:hypothetical protein